MINILRQVFHITHSSYNHFMKSTLEALNKFFGAVIALNIIHQIISSAGYFPLDLPILKTLYLISISIFAIEFFLRAQLVPPGPAFADRPPGCFSMFWRAI